MIVGIHGKKGSGKDALLERMNLLEPDTFVKLSFADLLKESVCRLFDITREELELMKNREDATVSMNWFDTMGIKQSRSMTIRVLLQRYGTEAHRQVFGDDFWVGLAMDEAVRLAASGKIPVFTDVRFTNEAVAVHLFSGYVIHVVAGEDDGDNHPSEVPLPDDLIDLTIDNSRRDDDFGHLDEVAGKAIVVLLGARNATA